MINHCDFNAQVCLFKYNKDNYYIDFGSVHEYQKNGDSLILQASECRFLQSCDSLVWLEPKDSLLTIAPVCYAIGRVRGTDLERYEYGYRIDSNGVILGRTQKFDYKNDGF